MNAKILLRNLPITKAVTQFLEFIDLDTTIVLQVFKIPKQYQRGFWIFTKCL